MKTYKVNPEFLDKWYGNISTDKIGDAIVTEAEIKRLSREWNVSMDDLMEQVTFCGDTRFEIMTDRFEFRFGTSESSIPAMTADEIFREYLSGDVNCPTREASFDTLEEAREVFCKRYANHGSTYAQPGYCFWLLVGDLAWIEKNEYDEDGEFDQGGDVYDISAEGYEPEDDVLTYSKAVELDDSGDLEIRDLSNEDLLNLVEELPAWDYPLGVELLDELCRRADIDMDEFLSVEYPEKDRNDLRWACEMKIRSEM